MPAAIPPAKIETMRLEYISSEVTLQALAERHGLSKRSLVTLSKRQHWPAQRSMHRSAPEALRLGQAADRAVQAVDRGWRERVATICDQVGALIERESRLLTNQSTEGATWQERTVLLRHLTEVLDKLRDMLPAGGGDEGGGAAVTLLFAPAPAPELSAPIGMEARADG